MHNWILLNFSGLISNTISSTHIKLFGVLNNFLRVKLKCLRAATIEKFTHMLRKHVYCSFVWKSENMDKNEAFKNQWISKLYVFIQCNNI
jgi:hypothetical protein